MKFSIVYNKTAKFIKFKKKLQNFTVLISYKLFEALLYFAILKLAF